MYLAIVSRHGRGGGLRVLQGTSGENLEKKNIK